MCPEVDDGPGDRRPRSGISLQTLIVASVASAAASFAVARIWGPGTLVGAAAAPVIIALVSEALRRPMRTVTATAKKVPSVPTVHGRRSSPAEHPTPGAPRESGMWRPRWWMAAITGLVAFAIVVGIFTIPDLIAGSSITGNGQPTTFFGGSSKTTKSTTTATTTTHATVTTTATARGRTVTRTYAAPTSPTTTTTTTLSSTTTQAPATPTTATTPATTSATATQTAPSP